VTPSVATAGPPGACTALLFAVVLAPGVASAEPSPGIAGREGGEGSPALGRVHHLDASTEAPRFGVEWREAARARLGSELPLAGRRGTSPLALELTPLLELHNGPRPDSPIPSESWRGRLGAAVWWRAVTAPGRRHELGLALEHESDHDTARVDSLPWFLSLNDLALEGAHALDLGAVSVGIRSRVRYYVLTCTRSGACDDPAAGQSTVGGALSVTADLAALARWRGLGPFAAAEVATLAPRADVHGEQRLVAHLGVFRDRPRGGRWQLYALALLGSDVGLRRYREVAEVGFGARWAPLW